MSDFPGDMRGIDNLIAASLRSITEATIRGLIAIQDSLETDRRENSLQVRF